MLKDLKTVRSKVLRLLEIDHEARNDDTYLFLKYIEVYHQADVEVDLGNWESFCKFMMTEIPKIESIRRARAEIQSTGLYIGTNRRSRLEEAEKVREYLSEMKKG